MKKFIYIMLLALSVHNVFAKKVKFAVDMRDQTVSVNGVHVMGDFQTLAGYSGGDWQPNTTLLTNEPGTSIYSIVVELPAYRKYEYRYVNGDQSYESEFIPEESRVGWDFNDNRWIYIDSLANDTTELPVLLFSGNAPHGKKLLKMRVSLMDAGSVDSKGIHATGTFNNYNYSSAAMYSFGRKIYEYQAYADSGSSVDYLFVNGNTSDKVETVPDSCAVNGKRNHVMTSDYITDTLCISTCRLCFKSAGIKTTSSNFTHMVFPNPVSSQLIIQYSIDGKYTLKLFNLDAKLVAEKTFNGNNSSLDVSSLKDGIYLLVSDNGSGKQTERIIISH